MIVRSLIVKAFSTVCKRAVSHSPTRFAERGEPRGPQKGLPAKIGPEKPAAGGTSGFAVPAAGWLRPGRGN